MKQRVSCIILVDLRRELGKPPVEATVAVLRRLGVLTLPFDDAVKKIEGMIDAGHRYMNFEQEICPGICLALGKSLREYQYVIAHSMTSRGDINDVKYLQLDAGSEKGWIGIQHCGAGGKGIIGVPSCTQIPPCAARDCAGRDESFENEVCVVAYGASDLSRSSLVRRGLRRSARGDVRMKTFIEDEKEEMNQA